MQNHHVHDNRFKHSTLKKPQWSEPIDATEIQPIPPQPGKQIRKIFSPLGNLQLFTEHEDCLYLNIWKQHTDQSKKPVIIYFYGGSLKMVMVQPNSINRHI